MDSMYLNSLWVFLNLVLMVGIIIGVFRFTKFILKSIRRTEKIEKNVEEILRILRDGNKIE